ncbi:hypothetical protein KW797_00920, partial [Candidatus Parcubacteria bacterium]|nr:hypothetical protein [Candidatus Parcubacteria bacterium]
GGTSNQVLGEFDVTVAGEAVWVNQTVFDFSVTAVNPGSIMVLEDVSLYGPAGNLIAGPTGSMAVSSSTLTFRVNFSDSFGLPVGKGTYILKGKVVPYIMTDITGGVITASTNPSTQWRIMSVVTGNNVALNGSFTMNPVTIRN